MFLSSLSLLNLRNYKKADFKFSKSVTLFVGPNTSGKTNLLEAIYFLSSGKSFRAEKDSDCLRWGEETANVECSAFALQGRATADKLINNSQLKIILTRGILQGEKVPLKKYFVNGVSKRPVDFIGNLRCVLFRPEDLELITNSPGTRRDYLDSFLVQIDREYRQCLLAYQKGLRQRNRLLDFIRDGKANSSQLYFWDKLLIKNGNIITNKRREYIDFLNSQIDIFSDLEIEYDLSAISEERLEKYKKEEVLAGATLVGPHRDDFIVYQRKDNILRNVHNFGSRGEQRLAVLSLKLCELDYIEKITGERPILLLDDIFSELDSEHRELVIKAIPRQQTIITTTDHQFIYQSAKYLEKMEVIKLG